MIKKLILEIHPTIVLILGGVVLLFIDNYFQNPNCFKREEDISIKKAVTIGFGNAWP
jgi:undecaprenyl-diphosphatase